MNSQQLDHNMEVQLLIALQSGSQDAFVQIYRLYSGRIYLNILKMVRSETDAEEMLQEVFFKVWNKRTLIDPGQSFRSYLFQIAKNTVYNFIRKNNREKLVQNYLRQYAAGAYNHIEERLHDKEIGQWLHQTIEQLPPQRRQVFKLCKIEGRSYAEVSAMLGISTSTINDHIVKATKFIKERHDVLNYHLVLAAVCILTAGLR